MKRSRLKLLSDGGKDSALAPARTQLVLGIMSGTSLGSVDYALCRVSADTNRLHRHWQVDFPPKLQRRLHAAARGEGSSHELAQLHHDVGRFYARAALAGIGRARVDLVGLHGQTLWHHPERPQPATFQAGEPAYLVEALGVPVVSNFRAADLAAGGQGAPLATRFHVQVFRRRGAHVCVNNLGGLSNVTSIDWRRGGEPRVLAFDTGPANVLPDLAMRHFTNGKLVLDNNGAWAARGRVAEPLLAEWLRLDYFRRPPPKSTGREVFGETFFPRVLAGMRRLRLSRFDVLATLTEFSARSLALNYRLHLPAPPERVVLAGGGAANPVLRRTIAEQLHALNPSVEVCTSDELGWPLQSVEPAAFALLAYLRVRGLPGNLPQTTGARHPVLLGQVSEPLASHGVATSSSR
jgi:anhydro-N-acetylmuramic acid kinase